MKKNYYDEQGHLIIRPYRLKDLAAIYDIHRQTMRKWIDELAPQSGQKKTKYFTIQQVSDIVHAIGLPQKIELKKTA